MNLEPMEVLDAMIAAGWGDVKRSKIPENWRELAAPFTAEQQGRVAWAAARERRAQHAAKMRAWNAGAPKRGPRVATCAQKHGVA